MSRRQTQQQRDRRGQPASSPRKAAPPPGEGGTGFRRWLTPKILLPLVGVLAAAAIGLGVVLATDSGGGETSVVNIAGCQPGRDPNCTARIAAHQHADFALFINGQQFDFNQPQFVSSGSDEKSPIVHIHPERYTVVHSHMTGTTWDEFFRSIGFELNDPTILGTTAQQTTLKLADGTAYRPTGDAKFNFYVNGVKVDGIAFTEIQDLDRVMISYGTESDAQAAALFASVTDQACISSERCTDRIPAGEPKEECQGGISTGCIKPGG